jgi:hypothetical protein
LKRPDGTIMVKPAPALIAGIEDVAELVDNLSSLGKLFTSCAGAAQMFKTNTLTVINAIDAAFPENEKQSPCRYGRQANSRTR